MKSISFKPITTLREPTELASHGLVAAADIPDLEKVASRYAVGVTPEVAALIDPDDSSDPIARQYIPSAEELQVQRNEMPDPIGDDVHSPVLGIVHRYPDRVLLKVVHVCAVYCRFCFRRETVGPGKASSLSEGAYQNALAYIRAHSEIWEVILTGGDPLMLSPRRLKEIMTDLASIDHVRELTKNARAACAAMIDAGIPMVSQSVLLRGVNDDAATLEALMRGFVECRIKPYYLHHGDLAPGTSHLRTTLEQGQELVRALRGRVSGLCQPDYVIDIPGGHGKAPAGPSYLSPADSFASEREQGSETRYRIIDYCGEVHLYPPEP